MFRRLRGRLTYANVVATLALFVALGGTAAASVLITSNAQVGRGTIAGHTPPSGKHPNIIAGSVNGGDVANGSLSSADLAAKQIGGRDLQDGSVTEQTLAAAQIGWRDLKGTYQVQNSQSYDPGADGDVMAVCHPGDSALSGGGKWEYTSGSVSGVGALSNYAHVLGRNNGQHAQNLTAYVECLPK